MNQKTTANREWFFYLVRCKDNSLYSGITVDIENRLKVHNNGTGARYTAIHRPVTLVYLEKQENLSAAMKRERQIKRWPKVKKESLIQGTRAQSKPISRKQPVKNMNEKVKAYIDKQPSPQKEICLKLRKIILKTFPDAKEEMKWGVPVLSGGKFYIGALKKQVNLGFSINGLTKERIALFEGKGQTMRHIKFFTPEGINEKKLVKLLKMAGSCPADK
jgi:predicted GIY-YIG superfamily endonuclease